jgi:hypothetical protein
MTRSIRAMRFAWMFAATACALPAAAFESDVHFGLTRWLAVQAGFTPAQAEAIAVGNRRLDSGTMDALEVSFQYACLGKDDHGARVTQDLHFPSAVPVPAPPAQRTVNAGSEAARKASAEMAKARPDQAGFLLHRLGESLHRLQDSWAHQGTPGVPAPGYFDCDPTRASAHPRERGGWDSHKADLTRHWPEDTVAMARATFEALQRFPAIDKVERKPQEWSAVQGRLAGFVRAASKSEKKAWFAAEGLTDVSFLEGITLPDGKERWAGRWSAHRLPPIVRVRSEQRPIAADVLDFYNAFFPAWISATNFDALATQFGAPDAPANASAKADTAGRRMSRKELAARLQLWRLQDHARVADIAHTAKALSAGQLGDLKRLAADPKAYAAIDTFAEAFYPLLPKGADVQPIYPFIVEMIPVAAGANPRAAGIAKLRHAPYDALAFVAEKSGDRWHLIAVTSAVDH